MTSSLVPVDSESIRESSWTTNAVLWRDSWEEEVYSPLKIVSSIWRGAAFSGEVGLRCLSSWAKEVSSSLTKKWRPEFGFDFSAKLLDETSTCSQVYCLCASKFSSPQTYTKRFQVIRDLLFSSETVEAIYELDFGSLELVDENFKLDSNSGD